MFKIVSSIFISTGKHKRTISHVSLCLTRGLDLLHKKFWGQYFFQSCSVIYEKVHSQYKRFKIGLKLCRKRIAQFAGTDSYELDILGEKRQTGEWWRNRKDRKTLPKSERQIFKCQGKTFLNVNVIVNHKIDGRTMKVAPNDAISHPQFSLQLLFRPDLAEFLFT